VLNGSIPESRSKQAEFQMGYIWVALSAALFAGFDIGAHLTFVISYDFPLGKGYHSFIQTHGHLQLVGWAGLFIIGISLHFIPRLAGVPVSQPQWIHRILWLMGVGLLLRSIGHVILPYVTASPWFILFGGIVVGSGLLEGSGIFAYLFLLSKTLYGVKGVDQRPALTSVKPYFGMMLVGWLFYASSNLILLIQMVLSKGSIIDLAWNEFSIQIFMGLVLLPVAFAFSIRTFPLYFRLAPIDWPVRKVAYAYLFALCLQTVPAFPPLSDLIPRASFYLSQVGMLLKGGAIFWFVWKLDILTRFREPWTGQRALQPTSDRRPTRPGMPDYGEFGRFERPVYAAYVWLVVGAFFEILLGIATLWGHPVSIGNDVIRHLYLLGFITHLIFGMSVRMIPGFIKKKRVASTQLVDFTFWLGTVATICRIFPLLLPSALFEAVPASVWAAKTAFAFSGIIGWLAVLCLAGNLWKTASL
jgi:uncharacterized protein involved in response to NO